MGARNWSGSLTGALAILRDRISYHQRVECNSEREKDYDTAKSRTKMAANDSEIPK